MTILDPTPGPTSGRRSASLTSLTVTVSPMVAEVITAIDARRQRCGDGLDPLRRSELGQYFTPAPVADFMAQLLDVSSEAARLLDPGAGVGSLTAAAAARWAAGRGGPLKATLVEKDETLIRSLGETVRDLSAIHDVEAELVTADFVEWAVDRVCGFGAVHAPQFDVVLMNPPYHKIGSSSPERRRLSAVGVEAPNIYAGFVALAARLLVDGGQLVAITPRSFTNGPYFRRFRRDLLGLVALQRIHVFDARDVAFADSEVLQENVIFSARRGRAPSSVVVSSSRSVGCSVGQRSVPYEDLVHPHDMDAFIHVAVDDEAAEYARQMASLPCRLPDLDLKVSTGSVVDFRLKEFLRNAPEHGTVPLIYPTHVRGRTVTWPQPNGRKPNAFVRTAESEKWLMPAGVYVVVKRFSAKEEPRRVVATVVDPEDLPGDAFAFENHLNVFHSGGHSLDADLARGLAAFLNTTVVDQYFRQFNGHTQVNAGDLRSLRYPTRRELVRLGLLATSPDTAAADVAAQIAVESFAGSPESRSA